jgi:hypothetical protein
MAPLIPLALIYGKARTRVKDPKVTLRLGSYSKRIGTMKLLGVVVFAGFGTLFIGLAVTGNSDTAPGFQRAVGSWMRSVAAFVDRVPNIVSLPLLFALAAGFTYAMIRKEGDPR